MKKRRRNGWTPKTLKGHNGNLRLYPPVHWFSLRTPKVKPRYQVAEFPGEKITKKTWNERRETHRIKNGKMLLEVLEELDAFMEEACRRYGYLWYWNVHVENARNAGWHLHGYFDHIPPEKLLEALRKKWLRIAGAQGPEEEGYCFYCAPVTSPAGSAAYMGKQKKAGWMTKRQFDYMGEEGNILPYRHGGLWKSNRARKNGPLRKKNGPLSASQTGFPSMENPSANGLNPLSSKDSSHSPATVAPPPAQLIHYSPSGSRCAQLLGIRIAPRYGPRDVLIPCPVKWATSHASRLSKRWQVIRAESSGPGFSSDSVDIVFAVPPGKVVEFELDAAPVNGWARIFRP